MASTYTSIEELNTFPDGGSIDNSLLAVHIAGSQTYKMSVSDFNQKSTESAQHYAELAEEAYDGSVAIQQAIQASTTAATTAATNAGISEANAAASETAAATAAQEAAASATSLANAVTSARNSANAALSYEEGAEDAATLAQSWAEGGTNTRQGENTNNAHYWALMAQSFAEAGISVCITQNLTKAQWDSHNIGDEDTWLDTVTERRGTRIYDIFIVTGTATDSLDAYFLIYRSTTAYGDLQGTLLSKSIAYSGDQGYGITASWRIQDTQANFTTYSTLGHHEKWIGSQGYRGTTRIGDIFLVLGVTSDTLTAYIMVYRSTTASGDLEGDCIGSVYSERGAQGERGDKGEPGKDGADGAPGAPGNGINSIVKTGTSGLVDTYTITMTNGDTATFTVTNGDNNTQLIKDTVGWTGKNLYKTENMSGDTNVGITTTKVGGVVTLNGTTTGEYVFPTEPAGQDYYDIEAGKSYIFSTETENADIELQVYVKETSSSSWTRLAQDTTSGNELSFTMPNSFYDIWVRCLVRSRKTLTNVTIYPMLRRAEITDPTYEPYHESVEVMYEEEIHGVNLFSPNFTTKTENGVTYTVNADNTISTSGTTTANTRTEFGKVFLAKGTYTLSGNPYDSTQLMDKRLRLFNNSDSKVYWDDGYGVTFTVDIAEEYTLAFRYGSGIAMGSVFRPMIRKADIDDPTYHPYNHQAIQNQLNAQGVLGAKNLLPNNATSQTVNGVTFTVNADGSVTANGTATANATFSIINTSTDYNKNMLGKKCRITGCPKNGSESTYKLLISTWGTLPNMSEYGNGLDIDIPSTISGLRIDCVILNGYTANNLTFYPMLRLASDPDDTYQPYAMTNRELTEEKINIADLKTVVSASSDFADFKTRIASL